MEQHEKNSTKTPNKKDFWETINKKDVWDAIEKISDIRQQHSMVTPEHANVCQACTLAIHALRTIIGEDDVYNETKRKTRLEK